MKQSTILLVEDDFLNRNLTKSILQKAGYRVLESKNIEEALALIALEPVDLAILDINLGNDKEEGIALGQKIKDHYAIPFIYLTAYANIPVFTQAKATQPHSYLTKPFKDIDLIAAIEIARAHTATAQMPEKLISSIHLKYQDHFITLPLDKIDYFESKGNYLLCYSENKVYKYRSTIKQILALPTATTFVQTHRGFLVNKDKIEKYNTKNVHINQRLVAISRHYKKNLFTKNDADKLTLN